MEKIRKNYRRTSLMMTNTDKKELIKRLKKSKSIEEDRAIKKKFYNERGLVPPTLADKWEKEAEIYSKL